MAESHPWDQRPPCFNHGKYNHCDRKAAMLFSDGTYYEFEHVELSNWVSVAYNTRRGTQFNYLWRDVLNFKLLKGWPGWSKTTTDQFHQDDNLNPYNWNWEDLEEWLDNHPGSEKEAFQEWLLAHKHDQTEPIQTPQMNAPEAMQNVPYGDVTTPDVVIYYSDSNDSQAIEALETLNDLEDEIPDDILNMIDKLVITNQPEDPTTSNEGNTDKSITFHENGSIGKKDVLHELGHNFAKERWGTSTPPPDSDYYAAMTSGEPPITTLGGTNPANDFAEAFVVCLLDPERLQTECPHRKPIVQRMIDDPDYPG